MGYMQGINTALDPQQCMPEPAATAFTIPGDINKADVYWRDQYRNRSNEAEFMPKF